MTLNTAHFPMLGAMVDPRIEDYELEISMWERKIEGRGGPVPWDHWRKWREIVRRLKWARQAVEHRAPRLVEQG